MKHHIAILFHESDRAVVNHYAISGLADVWRNDGHTVSNIFGTGKFIDADLILVHVDLSVVPDEYISFARQYPIALNDHLRDIRKSTFSSYLLKPHDDYRGQVLVKSNLNCAGIPESFRMKKGFLQRLTARLTGSDSFSEPADYLVYESLREVPRKWFRSKDVVVQRFCPEREEGLYHVRIYSFLGDSYTCVRLASSSPIVNDRSFVHSESVEVHPEIEKMRRELKFDYGKFDYVLHNGEPVLLDINKTTGAAGNVTPQIQAMRVHRARGIYSYFK